MSAESTFAVGGPDVLSVADGFLGPVGRETGQWREADLAVAHWLQAMTVYSTIASGLGAVAGLIFTCRR
jgi:hypothetical protein